MQPAIRVEQLAKKYMIGAQTVARYVSLRDAMTNSVRRAGARLLGRGGDSRRNAVEEFWALRDVSFEMAPGDVLGLIGRNGAGKSTLLKVLSRITEPSSGRVELRGRVASLLEVGTGFHPELSGRENIYLNGAILGMRAAEIRRKFDEIAVFADIEKFLDTPVKHYSSGMYMRLAFSVAAHLEPEILLVDEVLAVGDLEFQKKCLGKMHEISEGGRTVIFVSHNMAAIQTLCRTALYLDHGKVRGLGPTAEMITAYAADARQRSQAASQETRSVTATLSVTACAFAPNPVQSGHAASFVIRMVSSEAVKLSELALLIYTEQGFRVAVLDFRRAGLPVMIAPGGTWAMKGRIDTVSLVEGDYSVSLYLNAGGHVSDLDDLAVLTVAPRRDSPHTPYAPMDRGVLEADFVVESMGLE